MSEEFEKTGDSEYDTMADLIGGRVTPFLEVLCRLSEACVNFSYAAVNVSNTNVTETHEIKELLDLVFDIRKLAEETFDVVEDNFDAVLKSVKKECN